MIKVMVNDKMQKKYFYFLSEPIGKNFDKRFQPDLTPKQMLKMGIFGGKYMNDCKNEFPSDWFDSAKMSLTRKSELNYFKIDASQSLDVWRERGWIKSQDPRGWFQWYCRYYMGRRSDDDDRQIKRWLAMKRHLSQLKKNCLNKGIQCRIKQRQALLHWAYDTRKIK
jgi:hypothetical protein